MTDMTWFQSTSINLISIVIVLTFVGSVFKDFSGEAQAQPNISVYAGGSGYRHSVHVYRVERCPMVITMDSNLVERAEFANSVRRDKHAETNLLYGHDELRDFPLLRFGVLFLLGYVIVKQF